MLDVANDTAICQSELIGGEGKIVQIEESKLGKRKYNRVKENRVEAMISPTTSW